MSRVLHRAPWIATGSTGQNIPSLIKNGGVLTENGAIIAVGSHSSLAGDAEKIISHDDCVLAPALINCHSHLELSWMAVKDKKKLPSFPTGDFVGWIRDLLSLREQEPPTTIIQAQAAEALATMHASGTAFVVDIGNSPNSQNLLHDEKLHSYFLLELYGLTGQRQAEALAKLNEIPAETICTPHAPYSTGPELLRHLKKRSQKQLFSIHIAESIAEIEFLKNGSGPFPAFLGERGLSVSSFSIPNTGPVHYLDQLGVLDRQTLCVHGVHLEESEIDLLASRGAKVCLCPGSNRYLGVGKAPAPKLLQHSILPALGTDSLASNTSLSIWEEMRILLEDWPEIDPEIIFAMATAGGRKVIGPEKGYGMLAPACKARFLAIRQPSSLSKEEIFPFLVTMGSSLQPDWVEG